MGKHHRKARVWAPQNPHEPVPVSLVRPPGYKLRKRTRHPDAACWYWEEDGKICPLVFTKDTAGTWWEIVDPLWDKTNGNLGGDRNLRALLGKAVEYIEQDVFPDDEPCIDVRDDLLALLESIE